ncbi:hypothetical protein ET495_09745 [Xylanimonas allomyrinae]|uniref:Uncharacterized protein n=1 Tax=Xylanimonas allomyrinae TaxID=2509459 RepID=A0A4P6ESV3_9MICO|nr:hypothetical protein [Xylanimonas allomyrinae]QAY63487.1 hypothetical protein ET495_09745 [Xylanimonas allomyrinae]
MTTPPDQPPSNPSASSSPVPPEPYGVPTSDPVPYADPTAALVHQQPAPSYQQPSPYQQPAYTGGGLAYTGSGLYLAAAIINWAMLGITIVFTLGFGVIAAAWFVPMTISLHKAAKDPYKHTALGVCTLIFCGLISGILVLVEDGNRPPRPVQ